MIAGWKPPSRRVRTNTTVLLWLVAMLFFCLGQAEAASAVTPDPATCLGAISAAEREVGLPRHLLKAIALVETARVDAATGKIVPWAWSLDANGAGQMFETKEAAIAAVEDKLSGGVASVDVGCMQVNLAYHPHAFASLDEAFEPDVNVRYAARFLLSLYRQSGNWASAAMAYHSQTPDIGADYLRRLASFWPAGAALLQADAAIGFKRAATISANYTPQFASWLEQNAADAASLQASHSTTIPRGSNPRNRPGVGKRASDPFTRSFGSALGLRCIAYGGARLRSATMGSGRGTAC